MSLLLLFSLGASLKLKVTTAEAAQLSDIDDYLTQAFEDGVITNTNIDVLGPIDKFKAEPVIVKNICKNVYRLQLATLLKELNGSVGSNTIDLFALTGLGSNGQLFFVNGILESKTDPT